MTKTLSVGDLCVYCFSDTSFGSGNFVNRIPADRVASDVSEDMVPDAEPDQLVGVDLEEYDLIDGYMCDVCQCPDCEKCGKPVGEDEAVRNKQYPEYNAYYHRECLASEDWLEEEEEYE